MRVISVVLALFIFAVPLRAQKLSPEEEKEGFIALFNGQDFSGWRFSDNAAKADNWKVEDGVIKLSGGGKPHLASQWDFEDFDIRLEWRAMRANYNSGFYIRSGRNVGTNQINLAKGQEGGFVGGKIEGAKAVPDLQKKPMEWNEWRVVAAADKITFWCNGKLAWEGSNLKQLRGFVGLQAEGAPIEFRNIRIKETGFEKALTHLRPNEGGAKIDGDIITLPATEDAYPVTVDLSGDYTFRTEWKCDKNTIARLWPRGAGMGKPIIFGDVATGSGAVADGKVTKKTDYPLGELNYLEVKVNGEKATVWLNGFIVAESTVAKVAATVALEVAEGSLQVREPRVRFGK